MATILVVSAGLYFHLTAAEWCWIVLAITSVWTAEAFNTAFELLADATTKDFHPLIGRAKDVAAGAVLLTAIGASTIGLIIFWPRFCTLLLDGEQFGRERIGMDDIMTTEDNKALVNRFALQVFAAAFADMKSEMHGQIAGATAATHFYED